MDTEHPSSSVHNAPPAVDGGEAACFAGVIWFFPRTIIDGPAMRCHERSYIDTYSTASLFDSHGLILYKILVNGGNPGGRARKSYASQALLLVSSGRIASTSNDASKSTSAMKRDWLLTCHEPLPFAKSEIWISSP